MVGRFYFSGVFMENCMELFLSAASIREHKEHLCELKHKASILKKSGIDFEKEAKGERCVVLLNSKERSKIEKLLHDIKMHEIYFSSFGQSFIPCPKVKERFGSENNFAYLVSRYAEEMTDGFVCVWSDRAGRIRFSDSRELPKGAEIHLAIDLYEHAYFKDYGFKKSAYVRAALAHLDFSRINERENGKNKT